MGHVTVTDVTEKEAAEETYGVEHVKLLEGRLLKEKDATERFTVQLELDAILEG